MSCNIYDASRGKLIKMAPLYKPSIPDGKTVEPTDDIQILLKCAGIKDKSYTTINELLADSDSLATVIESENAIDYLVRSTTLASAATTNQTAMADIGLNNYAANTLLADVTWCPAICNSEYFESVLNAKIPVMTSNNTPSGVASASGTFQTGHDAFKIFDKNDYTWWCGAPDTQNQWVKYDFGREVIFYRLQFNITTGDTGTIYYRVRPQISSDDANWNEVFNIEKKLPINEFYNMETPISGRYVRLFSQYFISSGSYSYYRFYEFNAYGRVDV